MADFSLVATCFSEKHSFRVGTNLVKALKDLGVVFKVQPTLNGRKDDDWYNYKLRILVCWEKVDVHLFLKESRDELNLEHRWMNPISDEEYMERDKEIQMMKKGKYKPLEL